MTATAIAPNDLTQFDGHNVLIVLAQEDGSATEVTGKVEAASAAGIAFKEKGKRDIELFNPSQIVEITRLPEKPKPVVQRKMKEVSEKNVRQHLADRHGLTRTQVNQMTSEEALRIHDSCDHTDLGHQHTSEDSEEE